MLQISIVPVTDWQQNCSIVFDDQTKNGVVVDPGGDLERISEAVSKLEVKVQAIWLTHGHLDHAGSAEAAKKEFAVQIVGPHEADKMLLDNIEMAAANYNAAGFFNATPDRWLSGGDKAKHRRARIRSSALSGSCPWTRNFYQPRKPNHPDGGCFIPRLDWSHGLARW